MNSYMFIWKSAHMNVLSMHCLMLAWHSLPFRAANLFRHVARSIFVLRTDRISVLWRLDILCMFIMQKITSKKFCFEFLNYVVGLTGSVKNCVPNTWKFISNYMKSNQVHYDVDFRIWASYMCLRYFFEHNCYHLDSNCFITRDIKCIIIYILSKIESGIYGSWS